MVCVEDLRGAVKRDRFCERGDAKIRRQGVGDAPGQYPARGPVEHRAQIHKATAHREVCDISRPDVIGLLDDQVCAR